ncbi:MAG: porin [Candidatus Omnitrophica bacterium]|nr:porin [Candidatus Omnitrophota bacterium]
MSINVQTKDQEVKMYRFHMGFVLGFMLFMLGFPALCRADDAKEAELLQKVDAMEKRIKFLEENQVKSGDAVINKTEVEAIVDEKVSKSVVPDFFKDITMSGFVDTSYVYNTNHPDSGTNTARAFDTEANSFGFQAAKLALEKLPAKTGGVGFRTDLLLGEDAKVLNSFTNGFGSDGDFDVEQAYVDIMAPVGKGLDIKAGKFTTLAGAEVIESKDNWNFSRSLLFGYAEPATHTGVRASYPITDTLTGYLGVNNGWDDVKDNNKGKSVESSLAWAPKDWFSLNLAGMYGPEQAFNNHSNRGLVSLVATYQPIKPLTLKLAADYANEQDTTGLNMDKNGTWSGVAGYARYDINDKWSLSNRTEYFSDPNGLRVVPGTNLSMWENTSTLELRPYKGLITRLEYRYDSASEDIYTVGSASAGHQGTVGLEAIFAF